MQKAIFLATWLNLFPSRVKTIYYELNVLFCIRLRVKTFVCTDGGCTESEFSTPIQTGKLVL